MGRTDIQPPSDWSALSDEAKLAWARSVFQQAQAPDDADEDEGAED
jgi:hypothetical protein